MSDKKDWTKAEIEQLISIYCMKRELWDVECKEFTDRVKKRSVLMMIAETFGTTIEEITRKIHNLRKQYNREFKNAKSKTSLMGTGKVYTSKWPYFDSLTFLQGSSRHRANEDIPMDSDQLGQEDSEDLPLPREEEDTDVMSIVTTELGREDEEHTESRIKVGKRPRKGINVLLLKSAMRTLSKPEDQYDVFGAFVASELRNTRTDYLRHRMKHRIQQVILEISEEQEEILSRTGGDGSRSSSAVSMLDNSEI